MDPARCRAISDREGDAAPAKREDVMPAVPARRSARAGGLYETPKGQTALDRHRLGEAMSEMTDAEVFGKPKEMSDDEVFGKPDAPIRWGNVSEAMPEAFLDRVRAGQAMAGSCRRRSRGEGGHGRAPRPASPTTRSLLIDLGIFHDPAKGSRRPDPDHERGRA
jgi:hypothetical protein